ncbi:uncharacterized protein LOC121248387 [Juglans microcarpa x Juglans regia]|uniref:uncharacterized protein LOC121248387 n=1 Tax=Juglans microcarpa x Juglans regia TaxID=2249226 RepID=UPI001B7EBA11|nr:uncharacterized protein LOC121248387 [Juglans microcarpa x Juglans regia]XP_041002782.1 uncharacterized protein LOC121248387 [Juglans microcarpa x Juglans regia]
MRGVCSAGYAWIWGFLGLRATLLLPVVPCATTIVCVHQVTCGLRMRGVCSGNAWIWGFLCLRFDLKSSAAKEDHMVILKSSRACLVNINTVIPCISNDLHFYLQIYRGA